MQRKEVSGLQGWAASSIVPGSLGTIRSAGPWLYVKRVSLRHKLSQMFFTEKSNPGNNLPFFGQITEVEISRLALRLSSSFSVC